MKHAKFFVYIILNLYNNPAWQDYERLGDWGSERLSNSPWGPTIWKWQNQVLSIDRFWF